MSRSNRRLKDFDFTGRDLLFMYPISDTSLQDKFILPKTINRMYLNQIKEKQKNDNIRGLYSCTAVFPCTLHR